MADPAPGTDYERDMYSRPAAPPANDRVPPPAYRDSSEALIKSQQALTGQTMDILGAEAREKAPAIDAVRRANAQPLPAPPKFEQVKGMPQWQNNMAEWTQAAALFGALAGAFGRKSATTALNGMAGMMKGLAEGDLQAYEQNYKTWQANARAAAENNRQKLEEYEAIIKSRKLTIDQKMSEIELIAAKYQDAIAASAASQKNFTQIAEIIQKSDANQNAYNLGLDRIQAQHDLLQEKLNVELAKNGLQRNAAGEITIDTSPNSPTEQTAQAIAKYKRPPLLTIGQRNPQNALIMSRVQEINPDYDVKRYNALNAAGTSGARSVATRAANLEAITDQVATAAPAALAASDAMPRGRWVTVNTAIQRGMAEGSDPKLRDFAVKNLQLAELWARAMNPQGVMRIEDRALALEQLNMAQSPQAYRAAVKAIVGRIEQEKTTVRKTLQDVTRGLTAEEYSNGGAGAGGGGVNVDVKPPPGGGGDGWEIVD